MFPILRRGSGGIAELVYNVLAIVAFIVLVVKTSVTIG